MSSSEPVVVTHGLGRRYGDLVALEELDLAVRPGEVVALLGHNGSGKTTALRCIAGDLVPTAGMVRVDGADPHAEPEGEQARRALAFIADTPVFYRDLTLDEHLALVAAAFDEPGRVECGQAVLAELGMSAKRTARPHELSSGQRQKALLACIAARPLTVLLLDEPVLRLDPSAQRWLHGWLVAQAHEGVAVVLTTHQPRFAEGLADRAVCLVEGRVQSDEPFPQFLARGGDEEIGGQG
ncbi:MAG: ABC transporter ATP-binding protein [Euzebyaceae bacterium]|nr:ABC transporter ATP-binding protein [Euzebyaceae bacterium]